MPATLTILIADDDPVTTRTLAAGLQGAGFKVITAADAMQAFMMARRSKPHAILLDVLMPAGSGLGALQKIRASNDTQLIPVIAMSSSKDASLPKQTRDLGAAEFLPKPVDLAGLTKLLRRILELPETGS